MKLKRLIKSCGTATAEALIGKPSPLNILSCAFDIHQAVSEKESDPCDVVTAIEERPPAVDVEVERTFSSNGMDIGEYRKVCRGKQF